MVLRSPAFVVAGVMVLAGCSSPHDDGADGAAHRDSSLVDSGSYWDTVEHVWIGGDECSDLSLANYGWTDCAMEPADTHGRCAAGRGPALTIEGWDGCTAAAAALDGHAMIEWIGDVAVDATCAGAVIRHSPTGTRGTIAWGGSATLAETIVNRGPIERVVADAWSLPTGCVTTAHAVTATVSAVFATFPAEGGTMPLAGSVLFTLGAAGPGDRCAAGPGWWCATVSDPGWPRPGIGALPVCGTGGLPAPIGGCGDPIGIAVTVGQIACGDRVELGFVWPDVRVLCH